MSTMASTWAPPNFPDDLTQEHRWIAWRYERRPGQPKPAKVPIDPRTGRKTNAARLHAGRPFADAVEFCRRNPGHNLGFLLGDGYEGIDLDGCVTNGTELTDQAHEIVGKLNSYTERSPSGNGIHIIFRTSGPAKAPPSNRNGQFEYYPSKRFFAMTGDRMDGFTEVRDATHARDMVLEQFRCESEQDRRRDSRDRGTGTRTGAAPQIGDEELIKGLRGDISVGGLFDEDPAGGEQAKAAFLKKYASDDSRADMALAARIAEFSSDTRQIERIMRRSSLVRDKWERSDYLPNTIEKVIPAATGREFYSGQLPDERSLLAIPARAADDPSILLGEAWLCRGRACLIVGPTGVGKSTAVTQAAMSWARGEQDCVFSLRPAKPLRILIVQAENDDGDLAAMRDGILHELELSPEHRALVGSNLKVVTHNGAIGDVFCDMLCKLLERAEDEERPYDLVIIDPLLSFYGGNPNDLEAVNRWLRRQLHPVLEDHKIGALLVAHTAKPPRNKEDREASRGPSDYAYATLGSAEWANYARGVLVIVPTEEPKRYRLVAGKRASQLQWSDGLGATEYERPIRQSEDGICWHPVTSEDRRQEMAEKLKKLIELLPRDTEEPLERKEWFSKARENLDATKPTFDRQVRTAYHAGLVDKTEEGNKWFRVTDSEAMLQRRALDILPAGGAGYREWEKIAGNRKETREVFNSTGTFGKIVGDLEAQNKVRKGKHNKYERVPAQ